MLLQKEMTAEEFLIYADQHPDKRFDFIDGEMVEVSPKAIHGRIQALFAKLLAIYTDKNPIGVVYTEVLHVLDGKKFMPDICINTATTEDFFTTPPIVAIEIRSDSQSKAAQRNKAIEYIEHGVMMSILVFPSECLEVYRPRRNKVVLSGDDVFNGDDVLPGFTVAVKDVI